MSLTNLEILLVEPDKGSYSESIFFKTKLFISLNNILDSEAMRQVPLHRTRYSVTIHNTEKHKGYLNVFKKAKHLTVVQPLWSKYIGITADTINGDTIQVEDTSWSDFKVGDTVILYQQYDEANTGVIAEVGQFFIRLTAPTTVYKGMFAIPSFLGFVKEVINTEYSGEMFIKGDIMIEELQ